jgi:hypothetical protein
MNTVSPLFIVSLPFAQLHAAHPLRLADQPLHVTACQRISLRFSACHCMSTHFTALQCMSPHFACSSYLAHMMTTDIEKAGWHMSDVKRFEELALELIEAIGGPVTRLTRATNSKISPAARQLYFRCTHNLWGSGPVDPSAATLGLTKFLNADMQDLKTLNPTNCFWLRSPSYAPHHPFRQIKTTEVLLDYETVSLVDCDASV